MAANGGHIDFMFLAPPCLVAGSATEGKNNDQYGYIVLASSDRPQTTSTSFGKVAAQQVF